MKTPMNALWEKLTGLLTELEGNDRCVLDRNEQLALLRAAISATETHDYVDDGGDEGDVLEVLASLYDDLGSLSAAFGVAHPPLAPCRICGQRPIYSHDPLNYNSVTHTCKGSCWSIVSCSVDAWMRNYAGVL